MLAVKIKIIYVRPLTPKSMPPINDEHAQAPNSRRKKETLVTPGPASIPSYLKAAILCFDAIKLPY